MFNRFNKFQAAVALALLSRGALGDSYTNSTSSADLSSITSVSSASASATASDSLSSSDGTVYLPSTTISGDLTVTGKVIATEAVEVAAGGKLTLLDGEKYVFSSDLKVHGDLVVEKSEASYEGTAFDVSGETFEVSGNFSAEETGAVSASIYSFTPSSFKSSGDISLSLSKAKKGEVPFLHTLATLVPFFVKCYNGSTYVIVEPVSGNGTINIVSGNLYLHYPDTFTGQTVVFKLKVFLPLTQTETNATPIPVVGYTGKNQIAITADITALSYDGTTVLASVSPKESSQAPYSYYLNYDGVIATSAASTSASTTLWCSSGSIASTASTASTTSTASAASATSFTSGSASVYTTTLTYLNATSTVVVSCSETTDASGNIYTITTTVPCSSTTATITSCDENGCHVPAPTATDATATVSSKSYTTVTVTHCDNNGCNTKTVTSECSKETAATTISPKSYTTVTVTHCDDNGCNTKTVTSEASKQTSLATSTVTKSAAPTSHTAASSTFTGIVVQSEGMAAGLRTNALSTLAGIFILAFF
ncbi:AVB_G0025900.mRNA.1.CDS.1 [Saccharomyces cerevisiae]|nr:AVB_G0025900.mRNA.1.CDS.1 [Saccharomyces cerevisiae]CAI7121521.1 AVB_G0025900.mRNA.1.CDS.1 [Saccharomyces cerevisiae]